MKSIFNSVAPLITIFLIPFLIAGCSDKPDTDFTWTPETPKAGEQVQFVNLTTGANKFSWNLGNMSVSNDKEPQAIYKQEGKYIVSLIAYKGMASDKKTLTITVSAQ